MLSLLKKLFEKTKPLQPYETRVVEVVFGDGRKKYSAQMTCKGYHGNYVWGGIGVHRGVTGTSFNEYGKESYRHIAEELSQLVDTKEEACHICEAFRLHVIKDTKISSSVVECCKPRVINK